MKYIIEFETDHREDAEYVKRRTYDAINEVNIRRGNELRPERSYEMVIEEHVGRYPDASDDLMSHLRQKARSLGDCAHLDVLVEHEGTLACVTCGEKLETGAQEA